MKIYRPNAPRASIEFVVEGQDLETAEVDFVNDSGAIEQGAILGIDKSGSVYELGSSLYSWRGAPIYTTMIQFVQARQASGRRPEGQGIFVLTVRDKLGREFRLPLESVRWSNTGEIPLSMDFIEQ